MAWRKGAKCEAAEAGNNWPLRRKMMMANKNPIESTEKE